MSRYTIRIAVYTYNNFITFQGDFPMFVDRQTTSFIDNSIEAGILLGGNGAFTPWGSLSLSRARSLYDLV